ncbi:putative RNA-binding protein [Lachnellula hyalina]|uniref:Putative RNA-binding protein n=1 Tax=Lachnellula hyalina TaxID=1316788 RepID=A0A8H8R7H1_9HELO|nr:putative RNA-binding protein [Lachnellula hyalina]TVY29016.1 putative RNA-binding protein [Lachnellula hyalina]
MAPGKGAKSAVASDFNDIINADRQRRKNEALAKEVFSKGRRASAPGAGISSRKPNAVPSLASRIGVAKRTVSTSTKNTFKPQPRANPRPAGNVDAEWTHDLHSLNNSSASGPPRGPRASRPNRKDQLYSAINSSASSPALHSQFNIIGTSKPVGGMSIRGLAGPYIVMIKNLALGTTVADVESAITPVGGAVVSCQLIAERPKVIAEVEFENKEGADNVVDTLNNQNADGNILHVYHKIGGAPTGPKSSKQLAPLGPRADATADDTRSGHASSERYTPRDRERSRREDIMDGSYGFDDRMDTDDQARGSLYSDNLIGNRGRGRANSRDRGRGDGGCGNGGRGYR